MTERVGKIEVVIKGGQPWGFRLQANSENRSTVTIVEICPGGKADLQGELKVGDNLIKINGIQCLSLADALQLIDSAFRTLTLLVWRPSQCSGVVAAKEVGFKKFNKVSNFSTESYPPSYHIYENIQDISQGMVQKCTKTFSSHISTSNCKDTIGSLSNSSNKNTNHRRKLKSTSEYYPQKLISPNFCLKADFDDKYEIESFYGSDTKWKSVSVSNETQNDSKPLSNSYFPANVKVNRPTSYQKKYVPSVDFPKKNVISQRRVNKHFSETSLKRNMDDKKDAPETQACMYPNCPNQYQACKVHSPPERDIAYSASNPFKPTVRNQLVSQNMSHVPLKYDQITYENVELFNNSQENTNVKNIRFSAINGHSVSKTSTNSEIHLNEKKYFSANSAYANSMNLYNLKDSSLTENNFSRIINYENIPNKDFHPLSPIRACIQDVHPNEIFDQPSFSSSNSQVNGLSNSTIYMFCNKSSVNSTILTSANQFYSGCDEDNLEEELIEIEKKYENSLNLSESGYHTPPLPSPPPECETEILETDEPLPPPPSPSPDASKKQSAPKDTKIVQTIYANLEMLKIQCSVVSSGTQTTLQLNKNPAVKDFSNFGLEMPVHKLPQFTKDPLPQIQLESQKTQSLQTQLQNYASSVEKTVHNQEKNLHKNPLSLPVTSAYFTTSVPKAKLLTQYTSKFEHKNMTFVKELSNEKEELLESIAKKLRILKQEKAALQDELKQNEELGNNLASKLENVATKSETQKFKLHVEELEKITNLLLSLSGRLARTENALLILPAESSEEKELLEAKYNKLTQQYDEAVHLQKNIEKRNNQVSLFLYKYLTEDELVDYDHFIHMKVKLLVDYKDLLEKIKLGEEQLYALKSSFNTNGNEIQTDLCNNFYVL